MSFRPGSSGALRNVAVSGIDSDMLAVSFWVYVESEPTAFDKIVQIAASGTWRSSIEARPPVTSGWDLYFQSNWSTSNGTWLYPVELDLNTWYHVLIEYSRTLATNDPRFYVNKGYGFSEVSAPSGTAYGSDDEIHIGSSALGTFFFVSGIVSDVAYWSSSALQSGVRAALADGVPAFDLAHQIVPDSLEAYWLSTFEAYKKEPIQQAHLSDYGSGGAFDMPNPPLRVLRPSRASYYPAVPATVAPLSLKPFEPLVGVDR